MNKRLKTALRIIPVFLLSGVLLVAATRPVQATVPGVNTNVSVDSSGNQGDNHSGLPLSASESSLVSRDGRYVVFGSRATNLVSGDTNNKVDVFVRDLSGSATTRISVSTAGVEGNNDSGLQAVSETGRYVVFRSTSTNLIDGQTLNTTPKLYKHDRKTGETSLILTSYYGIASGISNDGRFLALEDMSATYRMYLYEISTQTSIRLDVPLDGIQQNVDPSAKYSSMSCDGSFIVFESGASNLVAGDTNGQRDIFLADLRNGLKLTNLTANGDFESRYPEISCNGQYVGFRSMATTFVSGVTSGNHYYRYDRVDDSFELLDRQPNGAVAVASAPTVNYVTFQLSDRGDAAFAHANNLSSASYGVQQIYFRNVGSGTTEKLSVTSGGIASDTPANMPSISADGRLAAYYVGTYSNLIGDTNAWSAVITSETGL